MHGLHQCWPAHSPRLRSLDQHVASRAVGHDHLHTQIVIHLANVVLQTAKISGQHGGKLVDLTQTLVLLGI